MTLLEYIRQLQVLLDEYGPDIEVEKWLPAKGRHPAPAPVLAYRRRPIKTEKAGGAGSLFDEYEGPARRFVDGLNPQFYHHTDPAVQKGDPVIRI